MKRTHNIIRTAVIRDDPDGRRIQAMRVAAAQAGISMNAWMLTLIDAATGNEHTKKEG